MFFGSSDRSSSSNTLRTKINAIYTIKSMTQGFKTNTTASQEMSKAKQRNRSAGYTLPRKITDKRDPIDVKSTNIIKDLFYKANDIYTYNVENMELLGTVYYLLPERVYGSQYDNSITYIPFVNINHPYCGCGSVITTDSTYTIVHPNNLIWFDAIRTPKQTNDWKDIPALYYETVNYKSNQGNFFAKSIYFDKGITSTTEMSQEDFYIDFANGIYSGAKVVRFLYDNDNYTREVQIYGYANVEN